ncbi:MAG: thioredoxin [Chitinispirillales bacterium]|jgi:thioredoxin 1|nr:thioredoxin [Chitinispirillales bacterium]
MGGALKEFTDQNFSAEVLSSSLPVVVDFWAQWCGPCKMLTPIIEEIAPEYEGRVVIGKLDIDSNPQTAAKYGINSIPSLLFFKAGEVVDQHTGLLAKGPLKAKIDSVFK